MTHYPHLLDQFRQLVATPSVSSTSPSWDQGNRDVIDLLAQWLSDLGFKIEIQTLADPAKANMIATLGTGPGGLVLAGHTDTVPFNEERWSSNPLRLNERNNRLYGLGSTDMKGFFPIAIEAVKSALDKPLRQPLIILATADEESSMNGARALAEAGRPLARHAIIGEPTGLRPVRMHKGIMMESVQITGRSGHSSNPELGNSALEGMHAVMTDLLSFREQIQQRFNNPFFDIAIPTLNLGCIHGGDSPNRICGQTELHFDLRLTPGCDNKAVREEICQRLDSIAKQRKLDIQLSSLISGVEPYEQAADSDLVLAAEKLTGHRAGAVAFATEAPYLQQMGMETIILGPGNIDRAHQPDEYIELDQVQPCIELLRAFIRQFCLQAQ
jgi:acetylornithine deacetylase